MICVLCCVSERSVYLEAKFGNDFLDALLTCDAVDDRRQTKTGDKTQRLSDGQCSNVHVFLLDVGSNAVR